MKIRGITIFIFLLLSSTAFSQQYWKQLSVAKANKNSLNAVEYHLNNKALEAKLPSDFNAAKKVYFPDAQGKTEGYEVRQTKTLSDELQRKYPNIRTYTGISVNNPKKIINFVLTKQGLSDAAVIDGDKIQYISKDTDNQYSVRKSSISKEMLKTDACRELDLDAFSTAAREAAGNSDIIPYTQPAENPIKTRVVRFAVLATVEYSRAFLYYSKGYGGPIGSPYEHATDQEKKEAVLGAIAGTINTANQILMSDLGIRLELVSGISTIFTEFSEKSKYLDKGDNPVFIANGKKIRDLINKEVGKDNYDLGHRFHGGTPSGQAVVGSIKPSLQLSRTKAYTRFNHIQTVMEDLIFAHEVGHQLGATHSFSVGNPIYTSAIEPGSGTTIMGYAGLKYENNVQGSSDNYFNHYSVQQIRNTLEKAKEQGLQLRTEETGNHAPAIGARKHSEFTIPKLTAYKLEGKATDADNDQLYYTWEEEDKTNKDFKEVSIQTFGPSQPAGATTRMYPPSADNFRYVPKLSRILEDKLTETWPQGGDWETVSSIGRTMKWTFVVRDRAVAGGEAGNVVWDYVDITVDEQSGPFKVTSQEFPETFTAYKDTHITWDVAGTDNVPINTKTVSVYFSADGGKSFPYLVAKNLPNNGAADIKFTNDMVTEHGRIMIKADDNIFLAVNKAEVTVKEGNDNSLGVQDNTTSDILVNNILSYNQTWNILNLDKYKNNEVQIFNLSGKLIFTKKGYNNSWRANVPAGIYIYVINLGDNLVPIKGKLVVKN
ncbi:reprolysin-like metallopeptidase [Riemerella columbipharyngis]|uniref:Por secretion system C-terminal sorting domain-containing protein n=1 Tax=Riemerella columbipharyngis TaxID=1071918 RepID=A0A1G6YF61_9FLAO|nr:zinc-dependent metalloprotease family protein [Riemerella columbipharyngis]SDD88245.1 Por secretion system C-terminal sorting domain-containing protein [Riemerella columbipharyngis]